jgi:dihydroorotase
MSIFEGLVLPASADFHVHLRDGEIMEAVTPTIRDGGVDTVYVMVIPSIGNISDWKCGRLMLSAEPGSSHHDH